MFRVGLVPVSRAMFRVIKITHLFPMSRNTGSQVSDMCETLCVERGERRVNKYKLA